jgi:hypothetical protein
MITSAEEYYKLLYKIQDQNAPSLAVMLPSDEKIYNIDLESRTIEAPEYVSVEKDHLSEIIYFKCPRYYDSMDLSTTVCIINYINAEGTPFLFAVPFYDVDTLSSHSTEDGTEEPYILFPWAIEQGATAVAGEIQFSIRFYKLDPSGTIVQYSLNTLPATTTVLEGIEKEADAEQYTDILAQYAETVLSYLKNASDIGVFWIKV